jgi:threonine/homoserine/homoserine lactone efflux protein
MVVLNKIHAMHLQQILALAMFAMISSITPGPNNMMLMASGVNYGFRRSLPHLAGICIGFPLMVFATGLGLYAVFTGFPLLHTLLKYGGALYILWLAWKLANASPMSGDIPQASRPMTFLQAAAFQWVNPKAWVMALSALTAFLPPRHSLLDTAIVAVTFGIVSVPCVGLWNLFGLGMRRYLTQPHTVRRFNISMALLLVASIYPVFIQ